MREIVFLIDENKYEYELKIEPLRNIEGGIAEENGLIATKNIENLASQIANSKETLIRFIGKRGLQNMEVSILTKSEIKAILDMMDAINR